MKKKALITGITGQDGSYLAEFLLSKGYEVHGIKRRTSLFNTKRIDHLYKDPHEEDTNFFLHYGDMTDSLNITQLIQKIKPDEIYNLAAQSHVAVSFQEPEYTAEVDALGTLRILEAVRLLGLTDKTKIYQASTSELYGKVQEIPQNEKTPFYPRSPYAVAKLYGYWITVNYREAYNMFAVNGILFNHESPRRGETFVTRKITRGMARILLGLDKKLYLGNLSAKRDWGHAKDYCIDLDTELLTLEGYKKREEIKVGDIIINFNKEKNIWEEDKVIKIYDIEYEGDMYIFEGNGVYFRCSENHRIFYKKKTKKYKSWNDLEWQESTAKEMYEMLKDKSLRTKYDFCFPGFYGIERDDFEILDDMVALIGYLVTEGHLSVSKKIGRGVQLSVSQSKKKYYNKLKEILNRLNLKYKEKEREDEVVEFIFDSKSRDKILDYFDGCDIHNLPSIIYKFSKRQLEILYKSMMNADGCWGSLEFISSRKKLAESFMDIANLIGYKTKLHRRKSGVWVVQVFSRAKKSTHNFVLNVKKEKVKENIWCIETEKNKSIITKRNDSVFVSGNCEAMWLTLQYEKPEDWVIATGRTTEIREFARLAGKYLGFNIVFEGEGVDEKGIVESIDEEKLQEVLKEANVAHLESIIKHAKSLIGKDIINVDPKYFRPTEVDLLLGDASKAREKLGWKPKITLEEMTKEMVESDLKENYKELVLKECGFEVPKSCGV